VVERMDEFEKELREHLQARPAPAGFADSVMRRIEGRKSGGWPTSISSASPESAPASRCCWRCGLQERR
jgi:hypothetical protein